MTDPTDSDIALWETLVESHRSYVSLSSEFLAKNMDRPALLRYALGTGQRSTAIAMAELLSQEELKLIFADLVALASYQIGEIVEVRELILKLPRDWVVANIDHAVEPHLHGQWACEAYRRFLELYLDLDRASALLLARRAAVHEDVDIAEAGREFLQVLAQANGSA